MKTMNTSNMMDVNGGITYNQLWNAVKEQAKNDWKAFQCVWNKAFRNLPKYFFKSTASVYPDLIKFTYQHYWSHTCGCY